MASNFDFWIVIEGLAGAGGSTAWCRNLSLPARSTDGSHEFMEAFSKSHFNVIYYSHGSRWNSKDAMVNEAVKVARLLTDKCFLWQVDVDELWKKEDLEKAETELLNSGSIAGAFQFDHLLCITNEGKQLVGKGEWGDGYNTRLFNWSGQDFVSHEPPKLKGQTTVATLSPRYEHNSYNFEQDVAFKSQYYKGHEQIYSRWKALKLYKGKFPVSLDALFGSSRKFNPKTSFIDVLKTPISCTQKDVAQGQSQVQ